jgi:hypothetical protein
MHEELRNVCKVLIGKPKQKGHNHEWKIINIRFKLNRCGFIE